MSNIFEFWHFKLYFSRLNQFKSFKTFKSRTRNCLDAVRYWGFNIWLKKKRMIMIMVELIMIMTRWQTVKSINIFLHHHSHLSSSCVQCCQTSQYGDHMTNYLHSKLRICFRWVQLWWWWWPWCLMSSPPVWSCPMVDQCSWSRLAVLSNLHTSSTLSSPAPVISDKITEIVSNIYEARG